MPKNSRIVLVSASLVIGIYVGSFLNSTDSRVQVQKVPERKYALNVMFSSWPGWKTSSDTLARIANSTPGLKSMFGGPPDGNTAKQIEEFESLINQRVNGIIVHAGDAKSLRHSIDTATAAGIPVVTYFGDVDDSTRLTFIGGDERGSARRLVEKVLKSVNPPDPGSPALKALASYPKPGITCSEDRLIGVKDALDGLTWIKLVGVVSDEASDSKGAEAITAVWQRNNGIDLIFGLGGRSATAAMAALRELGISPGKVVVTGWDADPDLLQGIKDGWITAASVPNFPFMIQLSVATLEAYHLSLHGTGTPKFPTRVEVEQNYIDKSNINEFFKE